MKSMKATVARILSHAGTSIKLSIPNLLVCTYAAVLIIAAEKIRLSRMLLKMVNEILFIQRFNLDTELGLYGTRNSSKKKKRSPPQKSNNLIKDSLMSNNFYLLKKWFLMSALMLSDLFFHQTSQGLTIHKVLLRTTPGALV